MSILYTGGSFEIYHRGHGNFLRQCKKIATKVVVALNTDEFIETYKGHKPVLSYEERRDVLLSCRYVDEVVPNSDGQDSKPTILSVAPDFICVGSDWAQKDKDYFKQMSFTQKWLDEHKITLIFLPYTEGISTTELKKRILVG